MCIAEGGVNVADEESKEQWLLRATMGLKNTSRTLKLTPSYSTNKIDHNFDMILF